MTDLLTPGYLILLALAAILRLRFRIWFVLALAVLLALLFQWQRVACTHAEAPAAAKTLRAGLLARPWPKQAGELPPLIAAFRALGDSTSANGVGRLYGFAIAKGLAGEEPMHFPSVAEALAWQPPAIAPNVSTNLFVETSRAGDRALSTMLTVDAPRQAGWPHELVLARPLAPDAREIEPGIWIAPKPANPASGTLSFPISARYRGQAPVKRADLTVVVTQKPDPDQPDRKTPSFRCATSLFDLLPGDARLFACTLPLASTNPRLVRNVVDAVEAFRAGGAGVEIRASGPLDPSVLSVPVVEPLIPEDLRQLALLQARDKRTEAQRETAGPRLFGWLRFAAIFVLGMLLPGMRGRSLSLSASVTLVFASAVLALMAAWRITRNAHTPLGWELIGIVMTAVTFFVPFVGGLMFGNLVCLRQRAR